MTKNRQKKVSYPSVDRLVKFQNAWEAKQAELINKHNEIAAALGAIEAMVKQLASSMASEVGKLNGIIQGHMEALSGLDLNILASAEVLKELVGQITVLHAMLNKVSPVNFSVEETLECKKQAEESFKKMVNSAFKTVRERLEREAQEFREAQERAKKEAEIAAKEQAESQTIEKELKQSVENERTAIGASTSGGPGSDFPEGAEIFGG